MTKTDSNQYCGQYGQS